MRHLAPYAVAALLAAAACESPPATAEEEPVQTIDLAAHQWKDRVILLFAPASSNSDYTKMSDALKKRTAGVKDRDLVVYRLFFDEPGSRGDQPLAKGTAKSLASRYDVESNEFTYLLIGKDGEVKTRSNTAVAVDDIFSTIDAMPMRQREMSKAKD